MSLNYRYENKLLKQGYQFIAGLDEAGRGSWAGPLVAGAVILDPQIKINDLKDSKLLAPQKRQILFLKIIKSCLTWGVGIISPQEIDTIGLTSANRLAFERAVKKLKIIPHYLLVDGLPNFDASIKTEFIIKGDQKIASIAAASIIAKVTRDQILKTLHQVYPDYNFLKHKGYGTAEHIDLLKKCGICEIHRLSYKPINEISCELEMMN